VASNAAGKAIPSFHLSFIPGRTPGRENDASRSQLQHRHPVQIVIRLAKHTFRSSDRQYRNNPRSFRNADNTHN
jgi:hypothetical protein